MVLGLEQLPLLRKSFASCSDFHPTYRLYRPQCQLRPISILFSRYLITPFICRRTLTRAVRRCVYVLTDVSNFPFGNVRRILWENAPTSHSCYKHCCRLDISAVDELCNSCHMSVCISCFVVLRVSSGCLLGLYCTCYFVIQQCTDELCTSCASLPRAVICAWVFGWLLLPAELLLH